MDANKWLKKADPNKPNQCIRVEGEENAVAQKTRSVQCRD